MHSEDLPLTTDVLIDFGISLGRARAFSLVAGRCSAAQAETLLHLREEKVYQRLSSTWKEFCPRYLHMSRTQADRIIGLWQEFGPGFFELSQLVRITPELYRAIEPQVKEGALHCDGEALELNPENSDKLAAAVAEIRSSLPRPPQPERPPVDPLDAFEDACQTLIGLFNKVVAQPAGSDEDSRLVDALDRLAAELWRPVPISPPTRRAAEERPL